LGNSKKSSNARCADDAGGGSLAALQNKGKMAKIDLAFTEFG
jgi:hypothetical protein